MVWFRAPHVSTSEPMLGSTGLQWLACSSIQHACLCCSRLYLTTCLPAAHCCRWITLFIFTFQRTVSRWPTDISFSNCLHLGCILQLAQHACLLTPDTQAVPAFPETIAVNLSIHSHPQIVGYTADPRGRMFSAIWMAAPAVGSIAWTVLTAARWAMTGGLVSQLGEEADARCLVLPPQRWAAAGSLATAPLRVEAALLVRIAAAPWQAAPSICLDRVEPCALCLPAGGSAGNAGRYAGGQPTGRQGRLLCCTYAAMPAWCRAAAGTPVGCLRFGIRHAHATAVQHGLPPVCLSAGDAGPVWACQRRSAEREGRHVVPRHGRRQRRRHGCGW